MNKYISPAIALGLALGAASTEAAAEGSYLALKSYQSSAVRQGGQRTASVKLETGDGVPMSGKAGAFGYAWLSDGGNNALVLVTHLPIDDSSHEADGSGFHAHVLDLKAPTPACPGANFEVDVENSKKNAAFDADYRWNIQGASVEVAGVPIADLGDGGIEGAASFNLKPVLGKDGKPTNLCVAVVDQI